MPPSGAVRHPVFARLLVPALEAADREGFAPRRDELLAGLGGTVLELGAGAGANLGRYPPDVAVLAVEPEPHLRRLATRAAAGSQGPVLVVAAVADRLPVPTAAVDAAVACLVLCSVADPVAALAELHRVVRPGGELRLLEHVRAAPGALRRVQAALDVVWPRCAGGCHLSREPLADVEAAGFVLERVESFTFRPRRVTAPVGPHVLAVARRR